MLPIFKIFIGNKDFKLSLHSQVPLYSFVFITFVAHKKYIILAIINYLIIINKLYILPIGVDQFALKPSQRKLL